MFIAGSHSLMGGLLRVVGLASLLASSSALGIGSSDGIGSSLPSTVGGRPSESRSSDGAVSRIPGDSEDRIGRSFDGVPMNDPPAVDGEDSGQQQSWNALNGFLDRLEGEQEVAPPTSARANDGEVPIFDPDPWDISACGAADGPWDIFGDLHFAAAQQPSSSNEPTLTPRDSNKESIQDSFSSPVPEQAPPLVEFSSPPPNVTSASSHEWTYASPAAVHPKQGSPSMLFTPPNAKQAGSPVPFPAPRAPQGRMTLVLTNALTGEELATVQVSHWQLRDRFALQVSFSTSCCCSHPLIWGRRGGSS